jgi:hypothetical protein
MANVKVFENWVKLEGQGHKVKTFRALSINVASPATLPRNGYVNGTVGNVIELVDHVNHTPTQNDVFKICNIKKFRFS